LGGIALLREVGPELDEDRMLTRLCAKHLRGTARGLPRTQRDAGHRRDIAPGALSAGRARERKGGATEAVNTPLAGWARRVACALLGLPRGLRVDGWGLADQCAEQEAARDLQEALPGHTLGQSATQDIDPGL